MQITRRFTTEYSGPYDGIEFVKRTSQVSGGKSKSEDVIVPSTWSQVATDIIAQKYFRRWGVPSKRKPMTLDRIKNDFPEFETDNDDHPINRIPEFLWPHEATSDATIGSENDIRQVADRLAGFWAFSGWTNNYFDTVEDAQAFYDEIRYMIVNQIAAPNSPQWFNSGLWWAYGITGPAQGHSYAGPDGRIYKSKDAYSHPALSACFIQGVSDDLVNPGGIMDLWVREARVFKYGGGSGSNVSKIRGKGEFLSGGGTSGGLMAFLKIGDRTGGSIKSGSTTRRAAKMVVLDADHPDIEEFVNWKVHEEQKVAALVAGSKAVKKSIYGVMEACSDKNFDVSKNQKLRKAISKAKELNVPMSFVQRSIELAKQGYKAEDLAIEEYDVDWQSEAYNTVSGQNSNNSVRVTNEFMKKAKAKNKWDLIARTTGKSIKQINAKDLWDDICYSAWACADPGLQFDTTINEWHTCPNDERINASNPCSEYMFIDDTACNLASMNLVKLMSLSDSYDWAKFSEALVHATDLWTIVLDISVGSAQYPSETLAKKSWQYRTLGLGYANLGALLMRLGLPYDSKESTNIAAAITAIMHCTSYATSGRIATHLGAFPRFEANSEAMLKVIANHAAAVNGDKFKNLSIKPPHIDEDVVPDALYKAASDAARAMSWHKAFRNAQVTVIAPTGTIGLSMDCDTTGIEPDFALVKMKKLAGGGYFLIINESIPYALRTLKYTQDQINSIVRYCAGNRTLMLRPGSPPCHDKFNSDRMIDIGFSTSDVANIEMALPYLFDIEYLNFKDLLSDETKAKFKDQDNLHVEVMEKLGITDKTELNDFICGRATIEGAPYPKPEHYPVFDCANKCGKYGKRYIEPLAHVRMMAAVQPLISGAISKTVNVPGDASVELFDEVYTQSWKLGTKAVAAYRDGSKLSQPLSSSEFEFTEDPVKEVAQTMASNFATRRSLPWRRRGYTQKGRFGGHTIYVKTGEYENGDLGEIFLTMCKEGSAFRGLLNAFAVAVSIGLQHGVPLDEFCKAFLFTKFEPNGIVEGHNQVKMTTSIVDFVFRELGINYLHQTDLIHGNQVRDEDLRADFIGGDNEIDIKTPSSNGVHKVNGTATKMKTKYQIARLQGFEGDPCPTCQAMTMVRNGTCLKCNSCGATSGCS